jgi:hypothetical protein
MSHHEHHTLWTATVILSWLRDPVKFVRDVFRVEPDAWQKDALRAIAKKPRLAMKACKGPGKSCVLAWIGWWYMVTHPHCKVIATSITKDNLEDGLWAEMATWLMQSKMLQSLFTYRKKSITYKKYPDTWFMVPRQFAKSATADQQANTLAGKHAKNMLFLIDETGDIPLAVMAAAEAALANEGDQKICIAGNPTSLEGMLYHVYKNEPHLWHLIEISSAPDDPNRTPRVTVEWAQQEIDRWGWDHPYVMVNVRGMFPPQSFNTLLGPEMVHAAAKRRVPEVAYNFSEKRLGVDVALYGDDNSSILPRQGIVAFRPHIMKNAQPHEIGNRVIMSRKKWMTHPQEHIQIYVDDTGGWGSGVTDFLNLNHIPGVSGVQFAGKADEPTFMNKRSEMWWRMAQWIKDGGCIPDDGDLKRELCEPYYFFQKGTMAIEPKKDIKARLGHSPDVADSLCLTFSQIDAPAKVLGDQLGLAPAAPYSIPRNSGKMRSRHEPFKKNRSQIIITNNPLFREVA